MGYDGANQRARTRVYDYCFMICQVPSFNAGFFFQNDDATTDIPPIKKVARDSPA